MLENHDNDRVGLLPFHSAAYGSGLRRRDLRPVYESVQCVAQIGDFHSLRIIIIIINDAMVL